MSESIPSEVLQLVPAEAREHCSELLQQHSDRRFKAGVVIGECKTQLGMCVFTSDELERFEDAAKLSGYFQGVEDITNWNLE